MTSAIAIVKQIPLFQLECFVIFFSLQQRNMSIANIIIKDFMHTIILPIAFPCTTLWRCGPQASALVMVILSFDPLEVQTRQDKRRLCWTAEGSSWMLYTFLGNSYKEILL